MENQQNKIAADYEEIDLRDVIKVLLKRKKMILGLMLAAAAITAIVGLRAPEKYRAETAIEIGNLAVVGESNGAKAAIFSAVESSASLKEKIERGVFDFAAREKTGIDSAPVVKASFAPNTNIVIISAEGVEPEKLKSYLAAIVEEIVADHQKKSDNLCQTMGLVKASQTAIVKAPQVLVPIKPNIAINAAVAAIAGAFLGIFWALAANWWRAKPL
jgi:uncharacterized protein involved in exopolysaccharide biosynthesis